MGRDLRQTRQIPGVGIERSVTGHRASQGRQEGGRRIARRYHQEVAGEVVVRRQVHRKPVAAGLPLDSVKDPKLRATLREIGLQVILGDSMRAMVNANSLGWEIFHKGRKGQDRELAFCMAFQGLAELELKMDREALWHWESAQILLPELHADLMQSYSQIAKVLDNQDIVFK